MPQISQRSAEHTGRIHPLQPNRDVVVADLIGTAPEWQERALCSQTDPEAFFPEKGGSTAEAKKICSRCEVRPECLEHALGHHEPYGIWGGLSERERRKLLKRPVGRPASGPAA